MANTSRRGLFTALGAAGVAGGLGAQHQTLSGPLANATVSFGEWRTDPPLDRFLPFAPPTNEHHLLPQEVTINAGGAVNFIIAGFHLVLVYDDGTQPGSIDTSKLIPGPPVPLIDDPARRIYRGLDPRTQLLDRVEVVHFPKRGNYLVICGVLPHFVDDRMIGHVRVLP
jgi:hypothetical protein